MIDVGRLGEIRSVLEEALDSGSELLMPVSDDSIRARGERAASSHRMAPDIVAQGQAVFRQRAQAAGIAQPLCAGPAVVDVAFDERLIDIAADYMGAMPAITGVNLRKSFVNELPVYDTLYFHRDGNSPRFVKLFFYLSDVGPGGGAFTYVEGSHRDRRETQGRKRWTDEELLDLYPQSRIKELTAKAGSVIVADTTGFHRGGKTTAADRSMLTVYYAVHPEFSGKGRAFNLRRSDFERLSAKQQRAADFLTIVDS